MTLIMGLEDAPSIFRPNLIPANLLADSRMEKSDETGEPSNKEIVITLVHFTGTGVVNEEHRVSPEAPEPQT